MTWRGNDTVDWLLHSAREASETLLNGDAYGTAEINLRSQVMHCDVGTPNRAAAS